jgi:hypothetical protein
VSEIDRATLEPIVKNALDSETVEVVSYKCAQLHGGAGLETGIYRFSGEGRDRNQVKSWSLILKVVRPEGDNTHVSDWNYYKREADAYRSGWLSELPGGLSAPRNFGITDHQDGTCWIWLEDVSDVIG